MKREEMALSNTGANVSSARTAHSYSNVEIYRYSSFTKYTYNCAPALDIIRCRIPVETYT
jgi:hypothetical protein